MPEATFVRDWNQTRLTLLSSLGAGELIQLPNGKAGYYDSTVGASTGDKPILTSSGVVAVPKTNGIVLLDGGPAYWDASANALHYKAVNDRDFFAGTVVGDFASGDTIAYVNLNDRPQYLVDYASGGPEGAFISALVGTVAVSGCNIFRRGGAHNFILASTSEAEKLDALSVNGFAPGAQWIVEGAFRVISDGSGTAADINLGIASATHATDADSIAEHLFLHLDANNVNINLQSKDGTTTVAAIDTTIDYVEGSPLADRVEFWMDGRTKSGGTADVQCYINGALVLGSTVFNLAAAVGPLFLLAHVEKTSAADTYELALDWLRVRIMQQ
jgi:hypothetical protein